MQRKLTYIAFLFGILFTVSCFTVSASDCQFTIAISVTDAGCYGSMDGTATVDPFGNDADYSYSWNTSPIQTTPTANNLSAGTYQLHIIDLNNCDTMLNITIGEPVMLNGTITTSNVSCNGLCDGSALALVTGGTVPYAFQWDDPNLQKDTLAENLCAGTYTVQVKDSKGCTAKKSINITEPAILTVSSTDDSLLCYGDCNAGLSASVSGGTQPYSYLWNDPLAQTNSNANSLCTGNYIITITDSNGCTASDTSIVMEPAELIGTITATNPLCYGNCDGNAKISATGGTGTYSYLWNTGSTSSSLSKLCEGTYYVIITDKNYCKDTVYVNLIAPLPLSVTATNDNTDCNNTNANIFSNLWRCNADAVVCIHCCNQIAYELL
jgi:hypothetical protein